MFPIIQFSRVIKKQSKINDVNCIYLNSYRYINPDRTIYIYIYIHIYIIFIYN